MVHFPAFTNASGQLDDPWMKPFKVVLRHTFDGLLGNVTELGQTTLTPGTATVVPFAGSFASVSRVHSWPPALGPLMADGARDAVAIGSEYQYLVVFDDVGPNSMSLIPVANPHWSGGTPGSGLHVDWWAHGIAAGTELDWDRRLLAASAELWMSSDYATAQLTATIAAEAALNRFARNVPGVGRGKNTLERKFARLKEWAPGRRPAFLTALEQLEADVMTKLKKPRDDFAHGQEPAVDGLPARAIDAIHTAVRLILRIEETLVDIQMT